MTVSFKRTAFLSGVPWTGSPWTGRIGLCISMSLRNRQSTGMHARQDRNPFVVGDGFSGCSDPYKSQLPVKRAFTCCDVNRACDCVSCGCVISWHERVSGRERFCSCDIRYQFRNMLFLNRDLSLCFWRGWARIVFDFCLHEG